MKKIVCLLMVAVLTLALSIVVFARGEPCDYDNCDGYVTYSYYNKKGNPEPCPVDGTHQPIYRHQVYSCDTCGYEHWDDIISISYTCGVCG